MKSQENSATRGEFFNPQDAFDQCVGIRVERDSDEVMADFLDAWALHIDSDSQVPQRLLACL